MAEKTVKKVTKKVTEPNGLVGLTNDKDHFNLNFGISDKRHLELCKIIKQADNSSANNANNDPQQTCMTKVVMDFNRKCKSVNELAYCMYVYGYNNGRQDSPMQGLKSILAGKTSK